MLSLEPTQPLSEAQEGELTECGGIRRAVTKLTRTSWALTYEAVGAAFTAAADALAFQLATLAGLGRCAL